MRGLLNLWLMPLYLLWANPLVRMMDCRTHDHRRVR